MGKNKNRKGGRRHEERMLAESAEELVENQKTSNQYNSDTDTDSDAGETFHFFWQQGSPFSQWHASPYELDDFHYTCAEHGMMHQKALLFQDYDTAAAILRETSPRQMKKLGRAVKGFKDKVWKQHRETIVYRNSIAKFTQNDHLREALLKTNGMLVEASPSDAIWGIGLHEDDAKRMPPSKWPGLNLLGKSLTRVRNELQGVGQDTIDSNVQTFHAKWDEDGVYFYQAYNDDIADWAIKNQRFGGPSFKPGRMTWIKPSFAWMLYRAGYGHKHNQKRILKIKLSHQSVASLLSQCKCSHGGGGSFGRVQWDPERDMMEGNGKEPRQMLRTRAIQIGLKGHMSDEYVNSVISIEDVTELAHAIGRAHSLDHKNKSRAKEAMVGLCDKLPNERPYLPHCSDAVLADLGMAPGDTAKAMHGLGLGKTTLNRSKSVGA